jgi:hypothetical protein
VTGYEVLGYEMLGYEVLGYVMLGCVMMTHEMMTGALSAQIVSMIDACHLMRSLQKLTLECCDETAMD